MELSVNGKKHLYDGPPTVGGLLRALGIRPQTVAVERNLRILERAGLENEPLRDGDALEIIRLVGGG